MADKPAAERTEKPTARRLEKARAEGRVPQSSEIPSALMISMLLLLLGLMGSTLYRWFVYQAENGLSLRIEGAMDTGLMFNLLKGRGSESLMTLLPFLLCGAVVSVFASLLVGGWAFSPKAVQVNLGRISPIAGLKNLISMRSLVRLLVSISKLTVIAAIIYTYARGRLSDCLGLRWATPGGLIVATAKLIFGVVGRIAIGLIAISIIDLLYQKWRHKRDLRMTLQEVKEERKQYEMSPHLRGRIRAVQIAMVRKRMLQEVPKADVVVTNPTHVSVALQYDAKQMEAPQVLAKGADLLSEKIREIARAHGVPVVQRPALARALYDSVEVGEMVPETLFVAVAEVLSMIYRLRNKRLNVSRNVTET
jgi:flagellar biosynthetic protein FlhB